jgi:hypothetical protein
VRIRCRLLRPRRLSAATFAVIPSGPKPLQDIFLGRVCLVLQCFDGRELFVHDVVQDCFEEEVRPFSRLLQITANDRLQSTCKRSVLPAVRVHGYQEFLAEKEVDLLNDSGVTRMAIAIE